MKGYAGKGLVVDLTHKTIFKSESDEDIMRKYIGGRALGIKMLIDEMPANADPLGPDNPIILLTGPITGAITPGSCKLAAVTKSPATQGYLDAYTSGMVASELKYAGYDWLMIKGMSDYPCIIEVIDDHVEIIDGKHLWGLDAFQAEDEIVNKYGHDSGRLVIGPAGENKVSYACVNSDYFRQLGRGGLGAVMGSKKLKAIVVRGSGTVEFADIDGMLKTSAEAKELANKSAVVQTRIKHGTPMTMNVTNNSGTLPTRNFQKATFSEGVGKLDGDGIEKVAVGTRACFGCLSPCGKIVKVDCYNTYLEGPEYETVCTLGSNLALSDIQLVAASNYLCDKLGLDTISAGIAVSFAMECAEKGLLEKFNTNIAFGSFEGISELLNDIAYRRGLGDVLASGVKKAAEVIGENSEIFAMHVRGLELPAYDPRGAFANALSYAVTGRGGCHRKCWPPAEAFAGLDPSSYEGKASFVRQSFNNQSILHSLVACDFHSSGLPFPIDEYAKYIEQVTGYTYTVDQLNELAERTETLIRMFNIREGSIPKNETLPARLFDEELPDGPAKGRSIDRQLFKKMLEEYYQLRGWDNSGVPTFQTAQDLDLADEWRHCFE